MNKHIHGIHHVTAIAGDPQENADFYALLLGLRLVKKTVNFDDPYTYHLYYGDQGGNPGSIMTFFPHPGGRKGRSGLGQLIHTAFSIPLDALDYWEERLKQNGIEYDGPHQRFGRDCISFKDPDGIGIELIADEDSRPGWDNGSIPEDKSVRGFHSVTLAVGNADPTVALMTGILGFRAAGEEDGRLRFVSGNEEPGTLVDVVTDARLGPGIMGVGAVHHVAWRIHDDQQQLAIRDELQLRDYHVSPVMDRQYFHSIYFREPGGILFEGATDPPGFAVDEDPAKLGEKLQLPPWLEKDRHEIERLLPALEIRKLP